MSPQVGDFGVVATDGEFGHLIRWVTHSPVNHAVIYVGDDLLVEASPYGVRMVSLGDYAYTTITWSSMPLTDAQRDAIHRAALSHIGAPYSWVDDACIALAHLFGVHVPQLVRDRLEGTGHLMCSQLVDVCYHEAGIELFTDGRIPGDVAPGDLYNLLHAQSLMRPTVQS